MIKTKKNIKMSIRQLTTISLFLLLNISMLILFPKEFRVDMLAYFSMIQLIINCITISIYCRKSIILILFLLFSWLFHCGQIVKYGFNISGEVPLSFYSYGTDIDFLNAFAFYFMSQITLTIGCLMGFRKEYKERDIVGGVNPKRLAITLIIIGIIPRVYMDLSRLTAALQNGYSGAYGLIFPSFFNTIAFMCDAGCFLLLYTNRQKKGNNLFFIVVALYKLLVMLSGMRQNPVCFLIVWTIFYCWYIKKINLVHKVLLCVIAFAVIIFIDFIGSVRSTGFSFESLKECSMLLNGSLIGDTLGEFGSGFCSLVVAMHGFPEQVPFGYGKTYLAAIMASVPKLLDLFPALRESITFTTLFSNTTYFGGSYLGEFYYNFSWLGTLCPLLVGYVVGKCQQVLAFSKNDVYIAWYAVLLIQLVLFIRGYIADMAQTSIWLWCIIQLYRLKALDKSKKFMGRIRNEE